MLTVHLVNRNPPENSGPKPEIVTSALWNGLGGESGDRVIELFQNAHDTHRTSHVSREFLSLGNKQSKKKERAPDPNAPQFKFSSQGPSRIVRWFT